MPSDSGNSPTKSNAICSKGRSAVGIGSNLVSLLYLSAFLFWHLIHPATLFATCSYHFSHVKLLETSSWVRYLLQCPATWLSWYCHSTSSLCSSETNQSPLRLSHVETSSDPSLLSSALLSLSFSSSTRSRSCPSSKILASIPDFYSPEHLDRPSDLPIMLPGR